MTVLPPPRYLAPGVLALALAWAVGPSVADAKGPRPKPDYTIKAHEDSIYFDGLDWHLEGTWTIAGIVQDSGVFQGEALVHFWNTLTFEGELGSFTIWYHPWDDQYDLFVVGGGTGVYEILNSSSGTFRATGRGYTFKGLLDGWW
ncbi:MAG: hypothetical protein ACYTG0_44040 [Planctomycetota bacterium]|jgi:hypothetical protein